MVQETDEAVPSHPPPTLTFASTMPLKQSHACCRTDDAFLSYLPLAHIFGRVAEELFLAIGARIGYWQGSPKTLMDDIGALRPTIFIGVPRIFDRIYSGVTGKARQFMPGALLGTVAHVWLCAQWGRSLIAGARCTILRHSCPAAMCRLSGRNVRGATLAKAIKCKLAVIEL